MPEKTQSKRPDLKEQLLAKVDRTIDAVMKKLGDATAKPTVADFVRLIQIRLELEPAESARGPITVRWVDECPTKQNEL